jgi:hypothetical protein
MLSVSNISLTDIYKLLKVVKSQLKPLVQLFPASHQLPHQTKEELLRLKLKTSQEAFLSFRTWTTLTWKMLEILLKMQIT